jgi:hypothetical protein
MASKSLDIPLQNVCRYVSMMKDYNSVAVVKKDKCKISGLMVEFISTNPSLFPVDYQMKMDLL